MSDSLRKLDDNQLALLAASGRQDAFTLLYDRHCAGVARTLAPFADCDRDTTDDLVQETFFRVIRGLKSYRPEKPFTGWLYTVALNVGRNHVRSRTKIKLVEPEEMEQMPSGKEPPSDWTSELLSNAALKAAARLPEHLRDVLALRISGSMPYPEIARITDIPEGTARRRLHEALNSIRIMLGIEIDQEAKENGAGSGKIAGER